MKNIVNNIDKEQDKIKEIQNNKKNKNNSNLMSPNANKNNETNDKNVINNKSRYHDKNVLLSPDLSIFGRSLNNQSKYFNLLINNGKYLFLILYK